MGFQTLAQGSGASNGRDTRSVSSRGRSTASWQPDAVRRSLKRSLPDEFRPRARGKPVAVLLMGLPGAGKTSVINERYADLELVAPDLLKSGAARGRAEHSTEEHRRSVRAAVDRYNERLQHGRPLVLDSTGSNKAWLLDRVEEARDAGYVVHVCFVDVPVAIALYRNRNRAAEGGRWTPEEVILDKASVLQASFDYVAPRADEAFKVENWHDGMELRMAELDLFLYPAPREHANLRPWEKEYGIPAGQVCPVNRSSRRCLRLGCWRRSKECSRAKERRMDELDALYRSREDFIEKEVLCGKDWVIEPNKFPYMLPPRVEHHTIWSSKPRDHQQVVAWVEDYLARERPDVVCWNYDKNDEKRTIETFHVHIYVCTDPHVALRLRMCDDGALDRVDDGVLPEDAKFKPSWSDLDDRPRRPKGSNWDR